MFHIYFVEGETDHEMAEIQGRSRRNRTLIRIRAESDARGVPEELANIRVVKEEPMDDYFTL